MNRYNSRGLVFSRLLEGSGSFLYISCYIRIWLFYFLEFTFPKIRWKFYIHFSQDLPNFFFGFSFYAVGQKCRLWQSWAWHVVCPWPWPLTALWRITGKKASFTELYIFRHDSCEIKIDLGLGGGEGGTISLKRWNITGGERSKSLRAM